METFKLIIIIFLVQVARYVLISVTAFWIIFKVFNKKLKDNFIQHSEISKKQIRHEVVHSISTALIFSILFSLLVHPYFMPFTKIYTNVSKCSLAWLVLTIPFLIIINDTYFYWMHRALHLKIFYKKFHHAHHVSTNPTPLATYSFHPVEAVLEMIWLYPLVMIVPIHKNILIAYATISFLNNVKGHLGINLNLKHKNRFINSSVHHSEHHKYFNYNYGLYFLFWDRWLKTERV